MTWFCERLFSHIYSDAKGNWRPCCKATDLEEPMTVETHTPMEYFASDLMNSYRDLSLAGKVPAACMPCKIQEDNGQTSFREASNGRVDSKSLERVVSDFKYYGEYKPKGRILDLKLRIFGNYCNLKCYMCHPINSSGRTSELKKMSKNFNFDFLGYMGQKDKNIKIEKTDRFDEILEEIRQYVNNVHTIEIIGGEPLMMLDHYRLLDMLIETGQSQEIELQYVTNLTKLQHMNKNFLDYLDKFKKIKINVSVDGIKEQCEWIRYGTKWDELVENIHTIRQYDKIDCIITFCASLLSVEQTIATYDYFALDGIRVEMSDAIVTNPRQLNPKNLPNEVKEPLIRELKYHPQHKKFGNIIKTLEQERNEEEFQTAIAYINMLDIHRGTDSAQLFPSLATYINNGPTDFIHVAR